jgi:hypothetical protein
MANQTVPTAFLEHLKQAKEEARAEALAEIEEFRRMILEDLRNIENAVYFTPGSDLAMKIVNRAQHKYEAMGDE